MLHYVCLAVQEKSGNLGMALQPLLVFQAQTTVETLDQY